MTELQQQRERLNDEQVRHIKHRAKQFFAAGRTLDSVIFLLDELLELRELRARLAAGPVMPETPSQEVMWLVVGNSSMPGAELMARAFYDAFRAALIEEQKCQDQ